MDIGAFSTSDASTLFVDELKMIASENVGKLLSLTLTL
jgi:hypothetical protein